MNNISRMPLASPPPVERKAEAIAEIKELYAAYEDAVRENEQNSRALTRMQDRIEMLENDLREEKERARICERKLIRLAANQRNIARIAQDGDEIMRSVREWTEDEQCANEGDVRDILARVPSQEDQAEPQTVVPPVNIL
jgi:predicted RNase H-like nuclease (RuvC/YqgF family)